jgi:hypothetical protein
MIAVQVTAPKAVADVVEVLVVAVYYTSATAAKAAYVLRQPALYPHAHRSNPHTSPCYVQRHDTKAQQCRHVATAVVPLPERPSSSKRARCSS